MRRDSSNLRQNDNFAVVLDTFHDKRNGFLFYVTPVGGMFDAVTTDERTNNADWNTVWQAKVSRFDGGWMAEIAIPFKCAVRVGHLVALDEPAVPLGVSAGQRAVCRLHRGAGHAAADGQHRARDSRLCREDQQASSVLTWSNVTTIERRARRAIWAT